MADGMRGATPWADAPDPHAMEFRDAANELGAIVRSLESGGLELEEALGGYARGVELYLDLAGRLATAEQQVRVIADANSPDALAGDGQGPS